MARLYRCMLCSNSVALHAGADACRDFAKYPVFDKFSGQTSVPLIQEGQIWHFLSDLGIMPIFVYNLLVKVR